MDELLWKKCLDGISEHVSPQHFATWFKPIRFKSIDSQTINLIVPNRFILEWVKEHYLMVITDVIRKVAKKDFLVDLSIAEEHLSEAGLLKKSGQKSVTQKQQRHEKLAGMSLNPKYTFENFVVGKANEFAHAACFAVSNHLASKYNPLFIYGCVGLGKTHLIQAIGQKVLEINPSARVCYYTSERFMNEFINYVSRQKMADFRGRFRSVDVLLIDDIQFWAGKEGTQEEFFHTFNTLYEAHKQIVVTSDKFPKDIDGLEERLRSRFEWGLIADIQPPDIETKIAILKKKAKTEGIKLPDEVAAWLSSISSSNVRELEGFLNRIIAVSSLSNIEITLQMSKDALKNLLREKEDKVITIEQIQKAVSAYYNIKFSELKSKRRHKTIALPRQIGMYLSREHGKYSFPEIGHAFGGKDHSTAIHAVNKIGRVLSENPELKQAIKVIRNNLGLR